MNETSPAVGKKRGRRPDKALQALRASLLKLLEIQKLDEITVRDIVVDAGVSPATFYRHYRSKSALLEAVADEEIDILVSMSSSFRISSWESSLAQIRHFADNRALWLVLLNSGAESYVRQGFYLRLRQEYPEEQWHSETWVPTELAIRYSVSSAMEIISWWLALEKPASIEFVAEILEGLTIRPTMPANAPASWRMRHSAKAGAAK